MYSGGSRFNFLVKSPKRGHDRVTCTVCIIQLTFSPGRSEGR